MRKSQWSCVIYSIHQRLQVPVSVSSRACAPGFCQSVRLRIPARVYPWECVCIYMLCTCVCAYVCICLCLCMEAGCTHLFLFSFFFLFSEVFLYCVRRQDAHIDANGQSENDSAFVFAFLSFILRSLSLLCMTLHSCLHFSR